MIAIIQSECFLYAVLVAIALNIVAGIYPAYAQIRHEILEAIESEWIRK